MCQTGLKMVADSSKQVGQRPGAEGSAGQLLPSPHLPRVPEGGAVDDLSPVAPSVQPGVQPAQRWLPLNAPFSLPGVLRRLGWGAQQPQRVQVALEDSGKPPATPPSGTTAAIRVFAVWLRPRWGDQSLLLQVGGQRWGEVLDCSPPTVVSSLGVGLPVGQQYANHLSTEIQTLESCYLTLSTFWLSFVL